MLYSHFANKRKLYTIGCSLYCFDHKHSIEGYYIIGEYGLAFVSKKEEDLTSPKNKLIVFTNPLDAEKYVQYLARIYRSEFRGQVKRGKHSKMGKFYVRKLPHSFLNTVYISYSRTLSPSTQEEKMFKGDPSKARIISFESLESTLKKIKKNTN